jgi:uncharacterized protein (DUF2141 family)
MRTDRTSTRVALALLCATLFSVGTVFADGLEVSGTVETIDAGPIYISIYNAGSYAEDVPLLATIIAAELLTDGVESFQFEGLDAGVYCIRCFQDLDGNEVLDMGRFGPAEPVGYYAQPGVLRGPPRFSDLSFDLTESLTGIEVVMQ